MLLKKLSRKFSKKVCAAMLTCVLTLNLTGCGGGGIPSGDTAPMKIINGQEKSIWFYDYVDGDETFGFDSEPYVLIFEDGKLTEYQGDDVEYTMGDFTKMKMDEIYQKVTKNYQISLSSKYVPVIETDETGNYASNFQIYIKNKENEVKRLFHDGELNAESGVLPIYDGFFSGLTYVDKKGRADTYFVTLVQNENSNVHFDTPGTKNLEVNPDRDAIEKLLK